MCTLVMLRRPKTPWPILLAANRDELGTRPWRPPARHWPDRPDMVAGLDVLAGGSWLGINDYGVIAAILNRPGTLGPLADRRSRGELVLEALDHAEARAAAEALSDVDPDAYRPFNLIVADRFEAFWLRHAGGLPGFGYRTASGTWRQVEPLQMPGALDEPHDHDQTAVIECHELPVGLSMITAHDLDDPTSPRLRHYRPRFEAAPAPDPATDDWSTWTDLLADRNSSDGDPRNAMTIVTDGAYGTVCSTLVALPAWGDPVMKFAAGRPDETVFAPVEL